MIKLLKNILNNQNSKEDKDYNEDLELLCGLMIEAAYTDGQIDKSELDKIEIGEKELKESNTIFLASLKEYFFCDSPRGAYRS